MRTVASGNRNRHAGPQDQGVINPPETRTSSDRQAMPPAWAILQAPLKQVAMMRPKSWCREVPLANLTFCGTTVHPRRIPVKPAYLENEHVSIATCSARMALSASTLSVHDV